MFSELKANDILFIDSTHVSKLGSDVNSIFFNILPRLNSGVIIHLHDIFWPFEYPASWIQDGRAWNEIYILRAMLQHNKDYSILFFSDYLRNTYFNWFSENVPLFLRNSGGNFWIKNVLALKLRKRIANHCIQSVIWKKTGSVRSFMPGYRISTKTFLSPGLSYNALGT